MKTYQRNLDGCKTEATKMRLLGGDVGHKLKDELMNTEEERNSL
jgi:hypothetical protein